MLLLFIHEKRMRLAITCVLTFLTLGCGPRIPKSRPDPQGSTLTVDKFLGNCYKQVSTPIPIDYTMSITVFYYLSGIKYTFSSATYNSTSSSVKEPVSIPITIPKTGLYQVEIDIVGQNCSVCASQWYGAQLSTDNCSATSGPNGSMYAAIPRWNATYDYQTYTSAISIRGLSRILNVPQSCGCTVPH